MTPTVETGLVRKPSWNATPLWSLPLCEHNGIHSHHHTYYERKTCRGVAYPSGVFPWRCPRSVFFSSKNGQASSAAAVLASAIVRSEKTHTLACNEFQMLICLQPQVVKAIYDTKSCISQHHCITLAQQRDRMNFPDRIKFGGYVDTYCNNSCWSTQNSWNCCIEGHKTFGTVTNECQITPRWRTYISKCPHTISYQITSTGPTVLTQQNTFSSCMMLRKHMKKSCTSIRRVSLMVSPQLVFS